MQHRYPLPRPVFHSLMPKGVEHKSVPEVEGTQLSRVSFVDAERR